MDFLPDTENPFLHVAGFQTTEWTPNLYSAALDAIVGNSTGLTEVGQDIGSQNNSFFQSELKSEQQLLLGVSPVTSGYVSGYQNELSLRTQANNYLKEILLSQSVVLIDLQQNSELEHYPLMDIFFKEINVVVDSAGTLIELPSGGKLASTALGVAEGFDSYVVNQRNLDDDQQAYNTTLTSLANCSHVSSLIDGNVRSALNEVARGLPRIQ